MNKVYLIGRLGEDPKAFGKESGVVRFSLAVDGFKDHTNWFRVAVFGKQGSPCMEYLKKGDTVAIDGSIKTGTYEKDGQNIPTTDIEVGYGGQVKFLRVKSLANGAGPQASEPASAGAGIDEVPF